MVGCLTIALSMPSKAGANRLEEEEKHDYPLTLFYLSLGLALRLLGPVFLGLRARRIKHGSAGFQPVRTADCVAGIYLGNGRMGALWLCTHVTYVTSAMTTKSSSAEQHR